jgi:hypothetical protein
VSMSTHVFGIKPADEKWKKMKDAWEACIKALVPVPKEVLEYFNGERPDAKGVVVNLSEKAVSEIDGDSSSGLEVNLDKVPDDVRIIRFVNSW